jgi:hypothetical protein
MKRRKLLQMGCEHWGCAINRLCVVKSHPCTEDTGSSLSQSRSMLTLKSSFSEEVLFPEEGEVDLQVDCYMEFRSSQIHILYGKIPQRPRLKLHTVHKFEVETTGTRTREEN